VTTFARRGVSGTAELAQYIRHYNNARSGSPAPRPAPAAPPPHPTRPEPGPAHPAPLPRRTRIHRAGPRLRPLQRSSRRTPPRRPRQQPSQRSHHSPTRTAQPSEVQRTIRGFVMVDTPGRPIADVAQLVHDPSRRPRPPPPSRWSCSCRPGNPGSTVVAGVTTCRRHAGPASPGDAPWVPGDLREPKVHHPESAFQTVFHFHLHVIAPVRSRRARAAVGEYRQDGQGVAQATSPKTRRRPKAPSLLGGAGGRPGI